MTAKPWLLGQIAAATYNGQLLRTVCNDIINDWPQSKKDIAPDLREAPSIF
jgi:hypothetical protein